MPFEPARTSTSVLTLMRSRRLCGGRRCKRRTAAILTRPTSDLPPPRRPLTALPANSRRRDRRGLDPLAEELQPIVSASATTSSNAGASRGAKITRATALVEEFGAPLKVSADPQPAATSTTGVPNRPKTYRRALCCKA